VPSLRYWLSSGGLSPAELRGEVTSALRFRDPHGMRMEVNDNMAHMTQKAGALLAAQAIFIVVDTWGMEHSWPRYAVLVSVVLLVLAALIVLTLLQSVYVPAPKTDDATTFEFEQIVSLAGILASRAARFNIALYMTFLSVILLGFGAVEASLA
jgi:hypothetical protein